MHERYERLGEQMLAGRRVDLDQVREDLGDKGRAEDAVRLLAWAARLGRACHGGLRAELDEVGARWARGEDARALSAWVELVGPRPSRSAVDTLQKLVRRPEWEPEAPWQLNHEAACALVEAGAMDRWLHALAGDEDEARWCAIVHLGRYRVSHESLRDFHLHPQTRGYSARKDLLRRRLPVPRVPVGRCPNCWTPRYRLFHAWRRPPAWARKAGWGQEAELRACRSCRIVTELWVRGS